MKQKHLIVLAAVTTAVVLTAVVVNTKSGASAASSGTSGLPLVEGLSSRINDVASLEVSNNGETVKIEKKGTAWVIQDVGGYPALFETVKKALIAIADLKIAETKTSDPERYEELGVQDPGEGEAAPKLVLLKDASGGTLASLVIGNAKPGRSPELYVRKVGEAQAWKAKGSVDLDTDPKSWMELEVANIPSDRTADMTIVHADGERLHVYKEKPSDTNFVVEGVPEGRELSSPTIANSLGGSLSFLSLEEVRPAAEVDFTSPLSTAEIRTWDGLVIVVRLSEHEDATWVSFEARYEAPPAKAEDTGAEVDTAEDDGEGADAEREAQAQAEKASSEAAATAVRTEAADLNSSLSPWAFRFPSYKQSNFAKRLEELLKPPLPAPGPSEGEADVDTGVEGAPEIIHDEGDGHDHSADGTVSDG